MKLGTYGKLQMFHVLSFVFHVRNCNTFRADPSY